MKKILQPSRRAFMRDAMAILGGGAGIGATLATFGGLGASARASAGSASGYRALVCVFLEGGNDSFNMLVPTDSAGFATYSAARETVALPQAGLQPITPATYSDGHSYGFHASMPEVASLFNSGALSVVANVGTLIVPTTKASYKADSNIPYLLCSHDDQVHQWMTSRPDNPALANGWGGQIADLLQSLNSNTQLSPSISIAGNNAFQSGAVTQPYVLDPYAGVVTFSDIGSSSAATANAIQSVLNQGKTDTNLLAAFGSDSVAAARSINGSVAATLAGVPAITTVFPTSLLGQQLSQVAKMIAARGALGVTRQVFFVAINGYDTHSSQLLYQPRLLADLSASLSAFYSALKNDLAVENQVTTFTASEFGRTVSSNNGGTDHGWGSHHLVMGGGVKGGDIFGKMPTLALGGPDDADGYGRIIPTISTYQYASALGTWLGASSSELSTIFPNLSYFPSVSFLNA